MSSNGIENNGNAKSVGKLIEIKGVVVDAVFPEQAARDLLGAAASRAPTGGELIAEVQQHLGDDRVRAVAMDTTDGLARGTDVVDTGAPISVPVGDVTLGRVWNVLGEPVDGRRAAGRHASAGRSTATRRRSTSSRRRSRSSRPASRSIDLIAPYVRGGKIGLFGGAGVGKTVLIQELIAQHRARSTAASRSSPASASAPARATTSCSRWSESGRASTRSRSATAR